MSLDDPDVQQLTAAISPKSQATDLGGVMSLNVRLDAAGLVLRVHQPFVSRRRLLALQQVRRCLVSQGLIAPVPVHWRNSTVFQCRDRWAELEDYVPHERPAHTFESYVWMFRAMGTLHRALAHIDLAVPRPLVATYSPPGSLRCGYRSQRGRSRAIRKLHSSHNSFAPSCVSCAAGGYLQQSYLCSSYTVMYA
jgi:hypothetical protein